MTEGRTAQNSTFAIDGVSSPLDSFEVAESSVLRISIYLRCGCTGAENRAQRRSANL